MQDLTPQLRTRLNRVERAVGFFVLLATLLLLVGLSTYLYHTAQRKGWFVSKVTYCTTLYSGAGLAVGDPVTLWGFNVGEITRIDTQPPEDVFNVYVEFTVRAPYFGYLWTEGTRARVTAADFLGKRAIEVTKGDNYVPTHLVWPWRELSPTEALKLSEPSHFVFLDELPGSAATAGSWAFAAGDLKDSPALASKLTRQGDSVSAYVNSRLSEATRSRLLTWTDPATLPDDLQALMVEDLNAIVAGESIWDEARFRDVPVRGEARDLLETAPAGGRLARLNRVLLEDAYPVELARKPIPPVTRLLEPLSVTALQLAASNAIERIRLADRTRPLNEVTLVWDLATRRYVPFGPQIRPYWLEPREMPAIADRVDALFSQVETNLSQHLTRILTNSVQLTTHADELLVRTGPLLSNLTFISTQLTNPAGSLGDWLLPVEMRDQLLSTLRSADDTLTNATATLTNASAMMVAVNTNLVELTAQLDAPLASLSTIISNLNTQVQANTNFVSTLNDLLLHTDELIQGFKRHWFLRGAFKTKPTNAPSAKPAKVLQSPKGESMNRR